MKAAGSSVVAVIRKFNRFYTNVLGLLDQRLLDSEFSLSEARVLYEIGNAERCTAKTLIDKLSIDAGYLSRMLKRFEKNGLLNRIQSREDGRLYYLHLTDRGREALLALDALSDEQIRQLLAPLSDRDRQRLANSMTAIEETLLRRMRGRLPVGIRSELRPGDAGQLIHLHGWLYAEECGYNHVFEGYVCKTFHDFFERYSPDKDRFWLAEAGERIVGAIAVVGHSERRAQLRWFILHPDYRGLGIGGKLLGEALQYCEAKGYRHLFLETTSDQQTAIRMYTQAGFKKTAEHANQAWGVRHVEQRYELRLP